MRGRRKRTLKGYDRCKSRTVKGRQCKNRALEDSTICWWHLDASFWSAATGGGK